MKVSYPIIPVAKPRMTQSDKWRMRDCCRKYWDFKDQVEKHKITIPEQGAKITFILPLPGSYSRKKKLALNGNAHQLRPDLSNLIKALEDAIFAEDSHIWNYGGLTKIWGYEGGIRIET